VAVPANSGSTAKTYTFHLTAKAKKTKVTASPATVTVARSGFILITPCSGPLTNNSEIEAGTYVVDCNIDIPSGITLYVDPGTILKFQDSTYITVEGTLDAVGTSTDPVTFTSVNDNSIGGDSGNGSPAASDWGGITVNGSGSLDLEFDTVDYASNGIYGTGAYSVIDVENDKVDNDAFGVEVGGDTNGSVVVKDNTFSSIQASAVYTWVTSAPTVEDNTAINAGENSSSPAFWVVNLLNDGLDLDPNLLGGNTANGGYPFFVIGGELSTGSLPAGGPTWLVTWTNLDIPSGVTLTVAPGTVVKGAYEDGITVEGTLDAVGTSTDPVTFTSVNDNSIGGDSGNGSPAASDWGGITCTTSATVDVENSALRYATEGIDISGGSGEHITIDSDVFMDNGTAVSVSAAVTTNAQIENNDFSGNSVAIDASSNWSTVTADCVYVPTMTATGNTFHGQSNPIVTSSDYDLITGGDLASEFGVPFVEDYPDGWTANLQDASNYNNQDSISVSYEPCIDPISPGDSYVAIAIPLDLGG
jgi:hypothetical protein